MVLLKKAQPKSLTTPSLQVLLDESQYKVIQLEIDGLVYEVAQSASHDLRDIAFDLAGSEGEERKNAKTSSKSTKGKGKKSDLFPVGTSPDYPPETEVDVLHWCTNLTGDKASRQPYWVCDYQIWNPEYPVGHAKGFNRKKQEAKHGYLAVVRSHRWDSRLLWVKEGEVRKACDLDNPLPSFEFHDIF